LDLVGRCDGKADRKKKKNQFYNIFEHKNGGAGLGIFFLWNCKPTPGKADSAKWVIACVLLIKIEKKKDGRHKEHK